MKTHRDIDSGKIDGAKLCVVKIGSALLVDDTGRPSSDFMACLADDICHLKKNGTQVIIVSSGAVALGRRELKIEIAIKRLDEKQACAAVGQVRLMEAWAQAFSAHGVVVAQTLLTLDDTERRRRWLTARATFERLLTFGIVPVVNENDTVATDEIRYGDNDRLAARAAQMVGADTLILLSDVDGLYTANPKTDASAAHIPYVDRITPDIEAMAAGPVSRGYGTGGMTSKIVAARIATEAGCSVVIASGTVRYPIQHVRDGGRATWFAATASQSAARKQWISGTLQPKGTLHIDTGAGTALDQGRSLLPAGVTAVTGEFEKGDTVSIVIDETGEEVACGLCAYSSADARKIAGLKSDLIEDRLGYMGSPALVHRNDLVMRKGAS